MKIYRLLIIVVAITLCASCVNLEDIDGRVSYLESKVAELDRLCGQLNSNIGSLGGIVSVMEGTEVITDIAEIKENGEVIGYAITFSKSGVKKIYNGKNGSNGANGTDGTTPEFKIEDDCWWVRYGGGEWKNVGQATGAPGNPGDPGIPGQTPEFKIEDGCWWIRYGEGQWVNYGQATGSQGSPGESAPSIGIVPGEGGAYYWTIGGEIMLDNAGQPFAAGGQNGITPELKIEDGYWWVRYGDGQWTKLGRATGEDGNPGTPGDSMFESVTSDGNSLTVVLAGGGGTFVLPVTADLAITFATSSTISVTPGSTINISYTITSSTGTADIDVLPTSGLKAKVVENGLKGTITVVVGESVDFEYDKVSVIVTNGNKTLLKKITFSESGSIVVTDEHTTRLMTCKGGLVSFNIAANVEYEVNITSGGSPINWVQHIGTKTMTPYCLEFQVSPNTGDTRTASITISSSETQDTAEFTVIQYASTASFVVTSRGRGAKIPEFSGVNLSGLVDFEGNVVAWNYNLTKVWPDEGTHSVEYFVEGATGFSMNNISNLVNLDVTDFN